jgi:regulator of sigma E protease
MEPGPIVGVRKGTPAEQAGFRAGDVLQSVAGEAVGDPFTLAQRLLPMVGESVEFSVLREGVREPVTLQATLVPPSTYVDNFGPGSPVSLECLGIAFEVQNVVKEVEADSPAEKQGLRTGDEVLQVQFLIDGEESGDPVILVTENRDGEEIKLPNWAHVHTAMNMLEDSTIELTYRRGESETAVSLEPVESVGWYHASRRLNTTSYSPERQAKTWIEALQLGLTETTTSLKQVLVVLQRLFTGQLSYKSMGGPIMIARAAGAEASHGLPRLLVFLTFLSANLAVLNFLPIPALDGGHMLFLAAEAIRGKPVNERLQVVLTLIGVGCLLSLMVLVFALDIHRLPIFQ